MQINLEIQNFREGGCLLRSLARETGAGAQGTSLNARAGFERLLGSSATRRPVASSSYLLEEVLTAV